MKRCRRIGLQLHQQSQAHTFQLRKIKRFKMRESNQAARIKILNIVLNHIYSHDWTNYDDFADKFVDGVAGQLEKGVFDLEKVLLGYSPTFFSLNSITKEKFLSEELSTKIKDAWKRSIATSLPIVRFADLFPEIASISDQDVRPSVASLDVPEDKIQQVLRDALREMGASPIPSRGKDSALEIADLEHFYLTLRGVPRTFSAVVKVFRSLSKLNWESISHQITKAYQSTTPDYVLLLSAREPVDGVITQMSNYGKSVGNKNLVVFVPPLDLAKFLRWRKII